MTVSTRWMHAKVTQKRLVVSQLKSGGGYTHSYIHVYTQGKQILFTYFKPSQWVRFDFYQCIGHFQLHRNRNGRGHSKRIHWSLYWYMPIYMYTLISTHGYTQ